MPISGKDIIESGLKLLQGERFIVTDDVVDSFRLAGVHVGEITLCGLKSPFGGEKFFKPAALSATVMNYPDSDTVTYIPCVNLQKGEGSLTALEKYGSFVATNANTSVPVYHLFKTAAAIQDCLIADGDSVNPFLLVSADFSGIQDTVYTISSKGALKTLRARSFMLELLTEHIVYEILHSCQAERHAIIYSGGGGFSLLLPNRAGTIDAIKGYGERLNRWALQEFSGKFFIALDATPCSAASLESDKDFIALRQSQSDNLDKLKRQKFLKQLDELFTPKMPLQLTARTECQITRRDDLPPEQMRDRETGKLMSSVSVETINEDRWTWLSESCYHQFKLGDKLIDAKYVHRNVEKPCKDDEGYLTFKGINNHDVYYSVSADGQRDTSAWLINSWEDARPVILYAKYVRKHGELSDFAKKADKESIKAVEARAPKDVDTSTFAGLASSSCGADLIGALRMDVDDMGNMFSKIGSLTELSVKSRMMNLFFKVYLNGICAANLGDGLEPTDIVGKKYQEECEGKSQGRNVSVVYAGGDDLFILGAWDETAELAFDIQRCFTLFTGGSFNTEKKVITGGCGISGGLTLHQPKFPLYQMAQKSGEAEHVAKNETGQRKKYGLKNRIALFYSDHFTEIERDDKMERINKDDDRLMLSIDWGAFNTVKEIVEFFALYKSNDDSKCLVMKNLPNSFTYTLLDITHEWHEKGLLYLPHYLWFLKKHVKEFDGQPNGLQFVKQNFNLTKFNIIHIPLIWIELLKRRG